MRMIPDTLDAADSGIERREQFCYGQRVCIKDAANEWNGQTGTVVEYDAVENRWRLWMDGGPANEARGRMVRTSNIEPLDEHPENWVKYQIPGDEEVWAYMNTLTQETRWEPPAGLSSDEVPESLPQNARAFVFHIVHRWTSVTRAFGQISQAASRMRPNGTAALSSGAILDQQDFVEACLELNLVQDDCPHIAAEIFDGIDLDGHNRVSGDHMLTVTDFHQADHKYHSVASGAFGQAQAPVGLLLFYPELVPDVFHRRAAAAAVACGSEQGHEALRKGYS